MIVDTSALVAILRGEPEREQFTRAVRAQAPARISAASYFEAGIQIEKKEDPVRGHLLDAFIVRARMEIVPVSVEQGRIARQAYREYGKGSGQRATQLCRLLFLRSREGVERAASLQGERLHPHGCCRRL